MRVHAAQVPHASTRGAGTAGAGGWGSRCRCGDRLEAIERLRDGRRGQALADAGGPGKDQARRQRVARNRARQQRDDTPMADHVSKRHASRGSYHAFVSYHRGLDAQFLLCPLSPRPRMRDQNPRFLSGVSGGTAARFVRRSRHGSRQARPDCAGRGRPNGARARRRLPRRRGGGGFSVKRPAIVPKIPAPNASRNTRSARCRGRSTRCRPSTGSRPRRPCRPPPRARTLRPRACRRFGRRWRSYTPWRLEPFGLVVLRRRLHERRPERNRDVRRKPVWKNRPRLIEADPHARDELRRDSR